MDISLWISKNSGKKYAGGDSLQFCENFSIIVKTTAGKVPRNNVFFWMPPPFSITYAQ